MCQSIKSLNDKYVLVPVELCVYVLENNLENTFRFFFTAKTDESMWKSEIYKR